MKTSGLLPLLLALAGTPVSYAQNTAPADPPPSAEEAQAKALRYYDALVKRPTGGYLFDRFYNAWLDTQTLDELEKYLTQRAEAAEATTGHRLILAFFHARQNASPKALELFAKALEKDPANAEAWFQKALAESRASNVDQALKDLEKALGAKPSKETTREARQLQGRLLVRAGRSAEAAKVWEALLAENPTDEELHEDLVEIQLTEGQTEDALKTALGLLEKTKDPYKRVQRRLRVGDIQSRLGNRDAAIEAYGECLADVGSDSWLEREILSQVEQVYRKDDAVLELREKYEAMIKQHPQRVALRRGLAKVQAELNETEASLKTWRELLPLAPGDRTLREAYVLMLADNKKIAEAIAQLQALITLEANDPELLMQLAEFQWRADKKDDCLKTLQQYLVKADQTTETGALRVAAQMERYELKDAALALYAETAKKFATSETALLAHAAALHRADKKEEARAAWRALAKGADGARLGAIARGVAAREEHVLAEELLSERLKDFMGDPTYLQFYCETALRSERESAAVVPARALLNLAKDTVSLDGALSNAVRVLDRAKQTESVLKELQDAASPTMQEKCLLAELLDRTGEPKKAEAVLHAVAEKDAVIGHAALVRVQTSRGEYKNAAESQEALVNAPGGRKAVHIQRLVELYERAGINEKALSWTLEWRKVAPGSVLVWIKESDLLAASGKPADALKVMRQAVQQFPADEEVRLRLGEAFRTEGKFADAARIYTMLFEDAKDTANKVKYAGELAKTAEMSGAMSSLLEQFEERRKGNRGSILPLLALAEIHRASGNYEGRRQALLEANRVKQGDPELLLEIARIEESEGKYESALEALQEAKKLDKTGKADERIIRVLFMSGRDQEALQMFFRSAGGEKMDPRTAEEMTLDLAQMGLWDEVASILQKLIPVHPGDYRLGFLYATALSELEKTEESKAELLRLLEIKTEMVLPKPTDAAALQQQQQQSYQGYYDEYGGYYQLDAKELAKLPPGLGDMLQFRNLLNNWKNVQQNRRNNYNYGNGRSAGIPNTLEALRNSVLMQCLVLSDDLDADKKAALWKEVSTRASLPPELLDKNKVPLEKLDNVELEKLVKEPTASTNLFALLIYSGGFKDPALAVRGWDSFKDTHPVLAWRCVSRLVNEKDEANLRPLREAMERVKNWQGTPSQFELGLMMGPQSNYALVTGSKKDIPPVVMEYAKTLAGRVVEWRTAMLAAGTDEGRQMAYSLGQFYSGYLERTDVKAWVTFLEEETERVAKTEVKVEPDKKYLSLPRVLVWPLTNMDGLPGTTPFLQPNYSSNMERLSIRTAPNSTSGYGGYGGAPADEERAARLKEALAAAQHPSVRIALRLALDSKDGAAVLDEIAKVKQPGIYHYALRASWERSQEHIEAAVKLLQEGAALSTLTDRERTAADEFLVTLALETDENRGSLRYQKMEPVMKAGKEAAVRLSGLILQKNDMQTVAGMMGALGMSKESKLLYARANPPVTQQQARIRLGSYFGGGNAQSQATTLLEKGRRDLAMRIITRELKNLARANSRNMEDYYVRQWTQLVSRFGLEPTLKTAFQISADEKNPEKLRRTAFVLGAMGNNAEALTLWEKLLEANPGDEVAMARVMQTALLEDLPRAQKMVDAIKPEQYGSVGLLFGRMIGRDQGNVDQASMMKMAVGLLERLKPEDYDKAYVVWVDNLAMNYARTGRLNRYSLPSLLTVPRPKDWSGVNTAAYIKEMNARQELFDRLLTAALKIPGSATSAASTLAALRIAGGAKEDEQVPMIRAALACSARGPHAPYPQSSGGSTSYGSSSNEVQIPDAQAFLARHAFTTKNPQLLDEVDKELKDIAAEVAKKNKGNSGPTTVTYGSDDDSVSVMARYRKLYFGDDKEVLEMLKKVGWPNTQMPEVFTAMERRNMEPGLVPLVEGELKRNSYSGSTVATGLTKLLLKVKSQKEAAEWLAKVAEIYLGPEDKRAGTVGSGNSNAYYFLYCFNDKGDARQQFFLTDQYYRHYSRFLSSSRSVSYGSEWKISGKDLFAKTDPKLALETLKASPFLGGLETFNALPRNKGERPLFDSCGEVLGKFPKEPKSTIIKALEPQAKDFGTALMLTYMKNDKPGAAMLDVVAAHEEEFKKLPAEKGADWLWLYTRITTDVKPATLAEPAKTLLGWLEKFTEPKAADPKKPNTPGGGGTLLDQFLAAKSFKDLGQEYHELDSWIPGQFGQMLAANPERSAELFKKLRELLNIVAKSGTANSSMGYYTESPVDSVLRARNTAWGNAPGPDGLKELRGILDAWQSPNGFALPYSMLGNPIIGALTASGREKGKDGKPTPVDIERVVKAMSENLDERQAILVVPLLESVLFNLKVHDKPELQAQVEKLVAAAPDQWANRALGDALALRMRAHAPSKEREKEAKAADAVRAQAKKDEKSAEEIAALPDPAAIRRRQLHQGIAERVKLPPYQERFVALSEDKNVNANVRAGVILMALQHDSSAEPALFIAGLRAHAEMLRGGGLLNEGQLREFTSHLAIWLSQSHATPPAEVKPALRETVGAWRAAVRRPSGRSYNSTGNAAASLLDLAILINDDETIASVLSAVPEQMSFRWVARLLGAGKTEAAARILLNGKDGLIRDEFYSSYEASLADKSQWAPSAALQDKVPAFLDSLQSPAHKALAAAMLADYADKEGGQAKRDERMVAAAKMLPPPSASVSGDVVARAVAMLAGNNAARAAIADQIAESVKDISLTMLPDAQDRALAQRRRVLMEAHLGNCLLSGNIDFVKKELLALSKLRSNNGYEAARMLGGITNKLAGATDAAMPNLNEEQRAAHRTMWAELVFGPEWYNGYTSSSYPEIYSTAGRLFLAAILYARDDKMAEFDALFAKQNEEVRTRLQDTWKNIDLLDQFKTVPSWPWPKKSQELIAERSRLALRMMKTSLGMPGFDRTAGATWLRDRIKQGVLRKEDLYAAAEMFRTKDGLPTGHGGIPAVEIADLYRADGMLDKADEWLKVAGTFLDETNATLYFNNLSGTATVLQQMGKKVEALAVMKSAKPEMFESKDYTKDRAYAYDQLLNELDTEVMLMNGPEKAMTALEERVKAAPDDVKVWARFVTVTEMLGRQARKDKKWAEAADWHMLSSIAVTRLGEKDKDRVDADKAVRNVADASLARAQAGEASPDFLTLVARGATWRYLDDGVVPAAGWEAEKFDDSQWAEGPAPLGYGDPGMGTETKPGGADANNRAITTTMRHSFELKDPASVTSLEFHFRVDDGCVVYLNGKELTRSNMPTGEVNYETRALKSTSAADETRYHLMQDVDVTLLKAGTNQIAVEVHQDKPTSTDLVFDADLVANIRPVEEVYTDYWKRKMSDPVGGFWNKLPEGFRSAMLVASEVKLDPEPNAKK